MDSDTYTKLRNLQKACEDFLHVINLQIKNLWKGGFLNLTSKRSLDDLTNIVLKFYFRHSHKIMHCLDDDWKEFEIVYCMDPGLRSFERKVDTIFSFISDSKVEKLFPEKNTKQNEELPINAKLVHLTRELNIKQKDIDSLNNTIATIELTHEKEIKSLKQQNYDISSEKIVLEKIVENVHRDKLELERNCQHLNGMLKKREMDIKILSNRNEQDKQYLIYESAKQISGYLFHIEKMENEMKILEKRNIDQEKVFTEENNKRKSLIEQQNHQNTDNINQIKEKLIKSEEREKELSQSVQNLETIVRSLQTDLDSEKTTADIKMKEFNLVIQSLNQKVSEVLTENKKIKFQNEKMLNKICKTEKTDCSKQEVFYHLSNTSNKLANNEKRDKNILRNIDEIKSIQYKPIQHRKRKHVLINKIKSIEEKPEENDFGASKIIEENNYKSVNKNTLRKEKNIIRIDFGQLKEFKTNHGKIRNFIVNRTCFGEHHKYSTDFHTTDYRTADHGNYRCDYNDDVSNRVISSAINLKISIILTILDLRIDRGKRGATVLNDSLDQGDFILSKIIIYG